MEHNEIELSYSGCIEMGGYNPLIPIDLGHGEFAYVPLERIDFIQVKPGGDVFINTLHSSYQLYSHNIEATLKSLQKYDQNHINQTPNITPGTTTDSR